MDLSELFCFDFLRMYTEFPIFYQKNNMKMKNWILDQIGKMFISDPTMTIVI